MKRNKGLLILTALLTLLPMVVGLLLWDKLPEQIPTHWNADGEVDGWSGKGFAVFGLCGILAAVHLLGAFVTFADPKNKGHNEKSAWLVLWICPVISALAGTLMYCTAFGMEMNVARVLPVFMGALFAVTGNYMPKFKQNSTIGIKLPWTLHDEENWNATHRFAGRIWLIGGVLIMCTGVFGNFWIMIAALLAMVLAPGLYSYLYYKKKYR